MIKILKNKKLILSFFIWLLSIGLFDLFFSLKKVGNYTNIELIFLAQIIGIGIVSFIIFILTLERIFHKKYSNLKARIFSSLSFIFFIIFGLSLIILPLVILNNEGSSELVKQTQASKNTLVSSGLKLGSSGEEVKLLQAILSTDKQIYPSGIVSGYFGELTKQAVINFQSKYNLTQTGEIDQQTADKINEVYGDKNKDYYLNKITFFHKKNYINEKKILSKGEENYKLRPDPEKPGFFIMDNAPKEKMTTVEELNLAMNNYRKAHGLNELNINNELCKFADQRAREISNNFSHDGFNFHLINGDYTNSGFTSFGENIWQGYFSGVHIVEYAWDKSEGHRQAQLDNWSSGCAGVYDKYVSFIFAR